jgi:hypothetical protein
MNRNVGTIDRTMRIIAGLALLSLIYFLPGPERWIGLVGVVLILTALAGWCPAYFLFGIRTCAAARTRS